MGPQEFLKEFMVSLQAQELFSQKEEMVKSFLRTVGAEKARTELYIAILNSEQFYNKNLVSTIVSFAKQLEIKSVDSYVEICTNCFKGEEHISLFWESCNFYKILKPEQIDALGDLSKMKIDDEVPDLEMPSRRLEPAVFAPVFSAADRSHYKN